MAARLVTCLAALVVLALLPTDALAGRKRPQSTFEFRVPTGELGPRYESTVVTVPNKDVFTSFNEFEAEFSDLVEDAIAVAPGVIRVNTFLFSFPIPTVTLSGEQTTILFELAGVDTVDFGIDYRSDESLVRLLCGSNIDASAHIEDLALRLDYDFYTGDAVGVDIDYSRIDVDYDCSVPIIGDLVEWANDTFNIFDVVAAVVEAIDDGEAAAQAGLNAQFTNLFSLRDALGDISESGPLEIRDAAEDVLGLLGGASTAAAIFISQNVTDELIDRLDLQTEAEINELRDLLRGLEDYIASNVPELGDLSFGQLSSPSFDLSDFLEANIPDIQAWLLARLDAVYTDAVAAVQDLETLSIDALEQFLQTDWNRLFGGVNVRLQLVRDLRHVILEAYHDAPATFIGRSEAIAPCFPNYTIADTENVTRYSVFNGAGLKIYEGTHRFHATHGLLRYVSTENYFGLHSYPTLAEIQLYGWGDYPGGQAAFQWPQCPVAMTTSSSATGSGPGGGSGGGGTGGGGSGGGGSGGGGGGGPGEPECGGNTGIICN